LPPAETSDATDNGNHATVFKRVTMPRTVRRPFFTLDQKWRAPGRRPIAWRDIPGNVRIALVMAAVVLVLYILQEWRQLPDWSHVPLQLAELLVGVWLSISVYRWSKFRSRLTAGLCPACGYDLRATPDRCPECGTASTPDKGST